MQTYSSPVYNRITPACAGKTIEDIPNRFSMGDHPRVCGKNVNHCYRDSVFSGSPPRVREKLTPLVSTVVATRITPACAGKTDSLMQYYYRDRDHPRVCGKNPNHPLTLLISGGSPPRVREKQDNDFQGEHQMRDHPRVCGKNNFCITHYQSSRGSPPRVREKLQDTTQPSGLGGITPACAGKTSCPAENIEIRPGSPPRVREKR